MTAPLVDRAVSLGGGHGQARTLTALQALAGHVTAIGTVADDGGSSGRLRRELGVLPPGDLRMAVTTLASDDLVRRLLGYRFGEGELAGHSLGNLVMVALTATEGDLVAALRAMTGLAGTPHEVLPSTTADVHLAATTPDGRTVVGQATIAATPGLVDHRLVGEEPVACAAAVAAIEAADLVVLGPGSVVTSVLPNLLSPGIAEAVASTDAPVVLVGNLDEQWGEGEGRSLADHVRLLREAAPGLRIDHLVAHDGPAPRNGRTPLRADGEVAALVGAVHEDDLLARTDVGGHDETALARVLAGVLATP